jgi:hypothetical protein
VLAHHEKFYIDFVANWIPPGSVRGPIAIYRTCVETQNCKKLTAFFWNRCKRPEGMLG